MKYMGSKRRIAKDILPIILKDRKENQWYVEPFVGGANIIDKVDGNRMGADINKYLIAMFKGLQEGFLFPDNISEQEYRKIRDSQAEFNKALVGFVGFGCSFGGKWFGGYARGKDNNGIDRNYCLESKKNILKQAKALKNVIFINKSYNELKTPTKSIIYCDPPYKETTKYRSVFNHDHFWQWVREKINEGHKIFVSEYNAPEYFECIWEKKIHSSLTKNTGSKQGIEKLFIYKG